MNIVAIARDLGAHLCVAPRSGREEIDRIYAGDRMSDLLGAAADDTLLVTHIANKGLVSLIELMDVPGICLVNGALPDPVIEELARESGAAIVSSPWSMYETCGRLYALSMQPVGTNNSHE